MSKRAPKQDWRDTPEANAKWAIARKRAQRMANETGYDYGLEANNVFKDFNAFMLPAKENRRGFELRCEVVSCEDLSKCQKGHGPGGG
jgi:hypothetical protein